MAEAAVFLRKRKDKRRHPGGPTRAPAPPIRNSIPSRTPSTGPIQNQPSSSSTSNHQNPKSEPDTSQIVTIKLFSSTPDSSIRWNISKFNATKDFDPTSLETPLLNRKHPGEKSAPTWVYDDEGKIIGKYLYDAEGNPIIGEDGKHSYEQKDKADQNLIGGSAGGSKKPAKKGIRDVYTQDKEVMRLRREEATPWVLESDSQEYWVGRMQEAGDLPTVLLVNDGTSEGFSVVPLGRTYRFEPSRPFKVLDPDAANKLFEHQAKYKIHDRWALRESNVAAITTPAAPTLSVNGLALPGGDIKPNVKIEDDYGLRQEERVQRLEAKMRYNHLANSSTGVRNRQQPQRGAGGPKWDDDDKREGRKLTRGMEGGVDEELDYDFAEEFQDDDDVNTFYRDAEEEEDAKIQEERQKKEYRLANANVGDRPQIEDASDEEDLFGEQDLTIEGKKLRKMMRKRRGSVDVFGDSEESDSSEEEEKPETPKKPDPPTSATTSTSNPPSADRSKGQNNSNNRGIPSPTGRRPNPPNSGKAATAPPGSGHSLAAQRATSRGASPRTSRGNSPSGRAASPEGRTSPVPGSAGREGSPSGGSNSRALSPALSNRGVSRSASPNLNPNNLPKPGQSSNSNANNTLGGTPNTNSNSNSKRKMSRAPEPSRKKKKSSTPGTTPGPEDIPAFPGMIDRNEVIAWFKRSEQLPAVPMPKAVAAWKEKIRSPGGDYVNLNQRLFLSIVSSITTKVEVGGTKMLELKDEYK